MKLRDVALVAGKELRETLRDRRTLTVMVLFPLVVYPLVSLLMAQVMASHAARGEARRSRVTVVGPVSVTESVRARLAADKSFAADVLAWDARANTTSDRASVEAGAVDAVVEVTPGAHGATRVRVVWDEARDESRQAHDRVGGALAGALAPGCGPLFTLEDDSVAPRARVGGYVLSKLLPLIVVVMIMLGAFYPAIDITAGERERGTLETILSAPVSRFDLMTGKVIAVATLSTVTGLLNMTSMSLTMVQGIHLVGGAASVTIPWTRAASTLIVVIPAAFLFASVMVAIGAMARSFKEAQTLLTPVYFLCFTPSLIAGLGDWDLAGAAAVVPGVNVTLLARDLILGTATLGRTLVVVASTLACGALALTLAARLYDSERLLAADDGTVGLGAWLRRLLGVGEARAAAPTAANRATPGQALALFGVAFVLMVGVFVPLQKWRLATGLAISQWVGLLGIVVVYARGTGRPLAEVLRVRRVPARAVLGALLVGASAWIVVGVLAQWLVPAPPELEESKRRFVVPADGSRGLVLSLALIALTPAVCEEALFRGAILRGLAAGLPRITAAVITGLLFGLFHLDLWRLLPTAMLGIALSLIALETDSILPSMLAHFTNNACLVILGYLGRDRSVDELGKPAQVAFLGVGLVVVLLGAACLRGTGRKATDL
ncbi:MAG TPA: ABC transporter permease subunit/CPBP intramembrane protease [Polyangia bacterium]|nr:ABC transporter permease subunit/CPBP intramembrane protease [Polyangia bacterium]